MEEFHKKYIYEYPERPAWSIEWVEDEHGRLRQKREHPNMPEIKRNELEKGMNRVHKRFKESSGRKGISRSIARPREEYTYKQWWGFFLDALEVAPFELYKYFYNWYHYQGELRRMYFYFRITDTPLMILFSYLSLSFFDFILCDYFFWRERHLIYAPTDLINGTSVYFYKFIIVVVSFYIYFFISFFFVDLFEHVNQISLMYPFTLVFLFWNNHYMWSWLVEFCCHDHWFAIYVWGFWVSCIVVWSEDNPEYALCNPFDYHRSIFNRHGFFWHFENPNAGIKLNNLLGTVEVDDEPRNWKERPVPLTERIFNKINGFLYKYIATPFANFWAFVFHWRK